MVCENCKQRHANVTVTQVQNGQKLTHHYCEVCASQFHPFHYEVQEEPISLQQFISNWFGSSMQQSLKHKQPQQTETCPKCGFTYRQFLKQGKFGCADCYSTFYEHLPAIFEKLHGGTEHVGKLEMTSNETEKIVQQIEELRSQIQQAIEQERFEDAASIRDKIKVLQSSLQGGERNES